MQPSRVRTAEQKGEKKKKQRKKEDGSKCLIRSEVFRFDFGRPHVGIGGKFGSLTQVVSYRLEPASFHFPLYQGWFFFFLVPVSMAMHQSLV